MKFTFADILNKIDSASSKKLAEKVPKWADKGLDIPTTLSLEQCSSSQTSAFKASIAELEGPHNRIADITGGLGVDTWAFSRVAKTVLHNEIDSKLSKAVEANFAKLKVKNVIFSNEDAASESFLKKLEEFKPDVIFVDPARRSVDGKKVFLLEDCSPNILEILPSLLKISPTIILKLSPMADITMVATRLGGYLKVVHILSVKGECKELLCVLSKTNKKKYAISVTDFNDTFTFLPQEESEAAVSYETSSESAKYLYEPSAALLKSGAFKLIGKKFSMKKIGRDTHLYTTSNPSIPLGKTFPILEVIPMTAESIRECGRNHPVAEVTAKAIKMTSDELRHKLRVVSGRGIHIFGVDSIEGKLLIVCGESIS